VFPGIDCHACPEADWPPLPVRYTTGLREPLPPLPARGSLR
jgi:hypothetical protein